MKGDIQYLPGRWASGIFMMLVLLWLTVSAPFVTSFQMQMAGREAAAQTSTDAQCDDEETPCNPFANTTEEKTETTPSSNFSEEYLHDHYEAIHTIDDLLKHDNHGHSSLYIAFQGELLSPPPEV